MWIKREEYERLIAKLSDTEARADAYRRQWIDVLDNNADIKNKSKQLLDREKHIIESYEEQIEKYKQKYADELQKRLELAKKLSNNTK